MKKEKKRNQNRSYMPNTNTIYILYPVVHTHKHYTARYVVIYIYIFIKKKTLKIYTMLFMVRIQLNHDQSHYYTSIYESERWRNQELVKEVVGEGEDFKQMLYKGTCVISILCAKPKGLTISYHTCRMEVLRVFY